MLKDSTTYPTYYFIYFMLSYIIFDSLYMLVGYALRGSIDMSTWFDLALLQIQKVCEMYPRSDISPNNSL